MADLSNLYLVAANDNVRSEDHNSLVGAAALLNAENAELFDRTSVGTPAPVFDAFGNLLGANIGGPNEIMLTRGAYGQVTEISSSSRTVAINYDGLGQLVGYSE